MVHVPSLQLLITFEKNLFGIIMQVDLIYFKHHFVSFKDFKGEFNINPIQRFDQLS
jgi:hypothetical protein